jgi:hypothetical protein
MGHIILCLLSAVSGSPRTGIITAFSKSPSENLLKMNPMVPALAPVFGLLEFAPLYSHRFPLRMAFLHYSTSASLSREFPD